MELVAIKFVNIPEVNTRIIFLISIVDLSRYRIVTKRRSGPYRKTDSILEVMSIYIPNKYKLLKSVDCSHSTIERSNSKTSICDAIKWVLPEDTSNKTQKIVRTGKEVRYSFTLLILK